MTVRANSSVISFAAPPLDKGNEDSGNEIDSSVLVCTRSFWCDFGKTKVGRFEWTRMRSSVDGVIVLWFAYSSRSILQDYYQEFYRGILFLNWCFFSFFISYSIAAI